MGADFPEPDGRVDRGPADWPGWFAVPEQRGGPVNSGRTPPHVPPRSARSSAERAFPLVPLPRRAPDDLV